MEHTPIYLAGQTAKMLGLPIELARNRTGQQQRDWLNGYAAADRVRMEQRGSVASSRMPARHLR
jgi:hypothetical protein